MCNRVNYNPNLANAAATARKNGHDDVSDASLAILLSSLTTFIFACVQITSLLCTHSRRNDKG